MIFLGDLVGGCPSWQHQELLDVVWGDDAPAFELLQREVWGKREGGLTPRSSRLEGFEGYGGKMGQ